MDSAFGYKLRAARQQQGLSQSALARKAGLTEKTVLRIESGTSLPRMHTAYLLAQAVGISLGELVDEPHRSSDPLASTAAPALRKG
jgi:putative transcriptional regulator